MSVWIIGDVHGNFKTLTKLIEELKLKENSKENIYFVGDIIDRGPASKECLELIIDNNYKMVLGNHEDMMLKSLRNHFCLTNIKNNYSNIYEIPGIKQIKKSDWFYNKGDIAFNNYQNDYKTLKKHFEYLKNIPIYIELNIKDNQNRKLLITHSFASNIINDYKSSFESNSYKKIYLEEKIMWNRITPQKSDEYFNVFGHTPVPYINDMDRYIIDVERGYANIDSGCVYKNKMINSGYMTAINFPSLKIVQVKNID